MKGKNWDNPLTEDEYVSISCRRVRHFGEDSCWVDIQLIDPEFDSVTDRAYEEYLGLCKYRSTKLWKLLNE